MNEHECQACQEYTRLSRRGFMQLSAATLAALSAPEWLPRVVFAGPGGRAEDSTRDVIVQVYLRGGADGLTMIPPYGDPAYYQIRPTLGIVAPDLSNPSAAVALSNSNFFGLAPGLAPLSVPYEDGKLAICHATGWNLSNPSRSHFDAQRWMELGQFNPASLFTGWLGRHLAQTGAVVPTDPVRAIGVTYGLDTTLAGGPEAIPVPGFAQSNSPNFGLTGSSTTRGSRLTDIVNMYNAVQDPLRTNALLTQQTIGMLDAIPFSTYQPTPGSWPYPATSFGYSMKSTAALLKNNMGVEAVAIDKSGWDTHSAQNPLTAGGMGGTMGDLANGLRAFYDDVISTGATNGRSVVVVVISEFGRRAAQNASLGTDHGFGNMMMVMGNRINGRQVLALGTNGLPGWPGLGAGQLFQNLDLKVTLDFRDVLAEICQNLLNDTNLPGVFPGYTPTFRNITVP
jgi:uncharacterized protein (DUF1501 family)